MNYINVSYNFYFSKRNITQRLIIQRILIFLKVNDYKILLLLLYKKYNIFYLFNKEILIGIQKSKYIKY